MCHCAQLSSISLDERVAAVVCMYTHTHVCTWKLKVDVTCLPVSLYLLAETESEISDPGVHRFARLSVRPTFVLLQLWRSRNTPSALVLESKLRS